MERGGGGGAGVVGKECRWSGGSGRVIWDRWGEDRTTPKLEEWKSKK